jgi:hypothetical protein
MAGARIDRARLPAHAQRAPFRADGAGIKAAFDVGIDDKTIATVDADGIALATIQALNAKLEAEREAKNVEIAAPRVELADIRAMLASRAPVPR